MPTRVKKNVAGYVDEQGRFRPIRSPQYVGSRKATARDRKKYSPAKAGDLGKAKQERALEAPWDTELRLEKEAAERKKRDQDRIMREIEGEAFGTGESRNKGYTLLQFVRAAGGIRRTFRHGGKKGVGKYGKRSSWDSGEIDRLSFKETGRRGLTTDDQRRGKTMDKMFQAARESGYDVTSIDDMMERIESEAANGSPTYATHGSLAYNPGSFSEVGTVETLRSKSSSDAVEIVKLSKKGTKRVFYAPTFEGKRLSRTLYARLYDARSLGRAFLNSRKTNPGEVDWKMRVCANCDKYTPNADIKKLGEINVCKACHKKLTASKAAKSQASLFDDQGSLFNPKANPPHRVERKGQVVLVRNRQGTIINRFRFSSIAAAKHAIAEVEREGLTSKGTVKKNPDGITMFAQLASGVASALQVRKMLNRKPARKKRSGQRSVVSGQRRKNPAAPAQRTQKTLQTRVANPRKQVTVPAKGDYYLLTIGSGDDIMAVYLQDGDKDGFSKRFKTVAAAKSYATKKRLRLKSESGGRRSNPRTIKATPAIIKALKANPTSDRPPVVKRTVAKAKPNGIFGSIARKVRARSYKRSQSQKAKSLDARVWKLAATERSSGERNHIAGTYVAKTKADAIKQARRDFPGLYKFTAAISNPTPVRKPAAKKAVANPLYVYARKEPARDGTSGKKDTVFYKNADGTGGVYAYKPWEQSGHPTRRSKSVMLNSYRWSLKWLPTRNPKPKANPTTTVRRPTFEKFQGRRATTVKALEVSRHAPKRLDQLGDLVGFKLMDENRERVVNPARVKLCASHGRLWIAGQRFAKPDASLGERQLNPIGHIDYVVYKTHKPHHGDPPGQHYIHQLGEEGGTLPLLTVDREGFPVLKGGQYKIQAEGIRD